MAENYNRKFGPTISDIRSVTIPKFNIKKLDNGVPIYFVNEGSQKLVKLEVVWEGGRLAETQQTQSRAFGALLKEGTLKDSAESLSQFFDYYGASFSTRSSLDFTTMTLFSLTKHFPKLVEKFKDLFFTPSFPEEELTKFKRNSIQRLKEDQSKNDMIAYRNLTESIFGKEDPYGYNSIEETYQVLSRKSLFDYYQEAITSQNCYFFLSGSFDDDVFDLLNTHFGQFKYQHNEGYHYTVRENTVEDLQYSTSNNLQQALRLGRKFGSRRHEDFISLSFMSNVFGGFFGSRLMKNVREDKGYTYNIFSDIDTLLHDGYFYIATELAEDYMQPALDEIYREMEIMREELVGEEELDMNKNYILGNILTSVDGPFQAVRLVKSAVLNKQDHTDLEKLVHSFATITAEEVRETARKYLIPEDFTKLVVG